MKVYIINLKSANRRREFQKQQLKLSGLDFEFFNAINVDDIDFNTYQKHQNDWKQTLTTTEFATYCSHKSLWQKIIKNNQPALILEDDALLSNKIVDFLDKINNLDNRIDLINLEVQGRKKRLSKKLIAITDYFNIFQLYQGRVGAAAYILYPSAAEKLLNCEQKNGVAPADVHITNCYKLINYQVEPAIAIQLENCQYYGIKAAIKTQSSIQKSKSKLSMTKVIYQLKRLLHYARFIAHNKRNILVNNIDFNPHKK